MHNSQHTAINSPPAKNAQYDWHRDLQELKTGLHNIATQLDLLLRQAQSSDPKQLVTVPEAAQLLGVSERAIRGRLARKDWPVYRCGRAVRVDARELKGLMKSSPQTVKA